VTTTTTTTTTTAGTSHAADRHTFVIISRLSLLTMRNVSDKIKSFYLSN